MNIAASLAGLGPFLAFLVAGLVAQGLFLAIYTALTPHRELALIRAGNAAAALSLGGAVVGFTLPLASTIAHSVSFIDFAVWAVIALVVQIAVYLMASLALGGLSRRIADGNVAAGTTLALASLAIGILNAACLTY